MYIHVCTFLIVQLGPIISQVSTSLTTVISDVSVAERKEGGKGAAVQCGSRVVGDLSAPGLSRWEVQVWNYESINMSLELVWDYQNISMNLI